MSTYRGFNIITRDNECEPGAVAYELWRRKNGEVETYFLIRCIDDPHILYALDTNGEVSRVGSVGAFQDYTGKPYRLGATLSRKKETQ
jgi:hypothetical protein